MKIKKCLSVILSAVIMSSGAATLSFAENNLVSASGNYSALPNSVDLSTSPCFPEIGSQGELGSCISFAQTYYQFSYEVNKLNNVTSEADRVVYSPRWTNSLVNDGSGESSNDITLVYETLRNFGALTNDDFPYNGNASSWPSGLESEKLEALKTRLKSVETLSIPVSQNISSPSNLIANNFTLSAVKEKLYEGKVLTVSSSGFFNSAMFNGECIAYRCYYDASSNGHRLTIVGYDNNKYYDVNGNGTIESCEKGAFKVANSWGTSYNQCGLTSYSGDGKTEGYFWILYDALNLNSTNNYNNWEDAYTTTRHPAFCKGVNPSGNNNFDYITVEHKTLNYVGEIDIFTTKKYALDLYCSRSTADSTTFNRVNQKSLIPYIGTNPEMNSPFRGVILFDFGELANPISEYANGYNWFVKLSGFSIDGTNSAKFRILDGNGNVISDYEADGSSQASRAIKYKTINLAKGDVNYDGSVNIYDSTAILNYLSGNVNFSNVQLYLADYNNDGFINSSDVTDINSSLLSNASEEELLQIRNMNIQVQNMLNTSSATKTELNKSIELGTQINELMN